MKSPETYSQVGSTSGFTLVELLLVIALVVIIGLFTSSVGISYYQSELLSEASDNIVSTLRQAQGLAMSGKNASSYGVYFGEDSYVLFEGSYYETREIEEDMVFPLNSNLVITGPREVVFSALTGRASVVDTLLISLGNKEKQVDILPSGFIDK